MRDLRAYFEDAIRILHESDPAAALGEPRISERDNQRGSLDLSLTYTNGSTFHAHLWVDCSGDYPLWVSYGFEYKDTEGKRLFRYDDARDWPHLPTFPHHLHLRSDDEVLPLGPPSLRELAAVIRWHLEHPEERWQPE